MNIMLSLYQKFQTTVSWLATKEKQEESAQVQNAQIQAVAQTIQTVQKTETPLSSSYPSLESVPRAPASFLATIDSKKHAMTVITQLMSKSLQLSSSDVDMEFLNLKLVDRSNRLELLKLIKALPRARQLELANQAISQGKIELVKFFINFNLSLTPLEIFSGLRSFKEALKDSEEIHDDVLGILINHSSVEQDHRSQIACDIIKSALAIEDHIQSFRLTDETSQIGLNSLRFFCHMSSHELKDIMDFLPREHQITLARQAIRHGHTKFVEFFLETELTSLLDNPRTLTPFDILGEFETFKNVLFCFQKVQLDESATPIVHESVIPILFKNHSLCTSNLKTEIALRAMELAQEISIPPMPIKDIQNLRNRAFMVLTHCLSAGVNEPLVFSHARSMLLDESSLLYPSCRLQRKKILRTLLKYPEFRRLANIQENSNPDITRETAEMYIRGLDNRRWKPQS